MIKNIDPAKANQLLNSNASFVLNIVTSWCGDCTAQAENLPLFVKKFAVKGIAVYQVNVQDVKNQYLSAEHEALTVKLGGHGYPRTVLISNNKIVDPNNVEIVSREQLLILANKFSLFLNI
ncbi:MAG: thiol-disulfide isomerase/thioredoxin [Psychromonas sp.]|jgi:thiol-disulfide isomerase/thioredoxin